MLYSDYKRDRLKEIDGAGSGLDADLLDGKEASEFADKVEGMCVHTNHITADYTLVDTNNAVSAGDVTIDDGVTVTVEDGATWTVV